MFSEELRSVEADFMISALEDLKEEQRISKNVQGMSSTELMKLKDHLVSSIQAVSQQLGLLLQERDSLQEEVAGRHVTIAQLLRIQEDRASQLGVQPAVQMSAVPRR
ncbi:uncharacterized protein LOC122374312 [Amphibalanus amphitrite]|uniref:uncharacterized protein LOC122374312 n=1 Tax=Amphibalanus amphitrite TaxID=1232801 RepID=UPI001C91B746|nr:uncharacterized protein LOC122374312 [Amphibalanus amphitrite]